MIAPLRQKKSRYIRKPGDAAPSFEELLAKMMPHFRYFASREGLTGDNYDECLQDMSCSAYEFYKSLMDRGLQDRVYYSPLAKYAMCRFKEGRRYNGYNSTDVLGEVTRLKERVEVDSLEPYDDKRHTWYECFVADGRVNVAREVAFKIDCEDWMATLDQRRRAILEAMIQGDSNQELSARFKVSQGRISQHRREFYESWKEFRSTDDRKQQSEGLVEELRELAAVVG